MGAVELAIIVLVGGLILYTIMGSKTSASNLVQLARIAGFSGGDEYVAAAIALAESKGDPSAYNKEEQDVPGRYGRDSAEDGLGSYGLWQIYLAAHPEFSGIDLYEPQNNANAAFKIFSDAGDSFRPWTSFQSGTFAGFLRQTRS